MYANDGVIPAAATLVDVLRGQAASNPDRRCFTFLKDGEGDEVHLTVGELDERARAIAGFLQAEGLAGSRAFLFHPPGLEFLSALFGCFYAGVTAVPAYPPRANRSIERLRALAASARASVVLTTSAVLTRDPSRSDAACLQSVPWLATDAISSEHAADWIEPDVDGRSLAVLQFTSGSTDDPKGVMLSHANLLHNSGLIRRAFGHSTETKGVIWLPPYHDMGLIGGIFQPLYSGFTGVLFAPVDFVKRPIRWLQAISKYGANTSGGPNFAYDLCVQSTTPEQRAGLDLSSWDLAFTGAEPIHAATLDRFVEAFAPCGFRREALYPCYGLAESTLIVTGGAKQAAPVVLPLSGPAIDRHEVQPAGPDDTKVRLAVGCGAPLDSVEIVIVDPATAAPCPSGRVGEVWVAGPSVAQGYWERPVETRRTFQANIPGAADRPYLRTGDLGFLHDGQLFVTGRIKELIIIRGRNYYPQDIERIAEAAHPAVRTGNLAAFAVPGDIEERLALVAEVKRGSRDVDVMEVAAAVRRAVATEFGLDVQEVVLIRTNSLPKTSSGKIQRTACRAEFLAGSLDVVGAWSRRDAEETGPDPDSEPTTEAERILAEVWAEVLEMDRVGIHDNFFEIGGTSIQAMQILEAAAQAGLELTPEMLLEHQTVAELASACDATATTVQTVPFPSLEAAAA
jgi:acyl-CoA synthetase (AMP-forming)/AMP-acid ligase II